MKVQLAIIMDDIKNISYKKDSSLAILLAAQERGWKLFYIEQRNLYLKSSQTRALVKSLKVFNNSKKWYVLENESDIELSNLDIILMRKDPPFDIDFLYTTHMLEFAACRGLLILNNPRSLRDCNEKIFALNFIKHTPPCVVSSRIDILKDFVEEHCDVILKPLDGMGGKSIFRCRTGDPNLSVILETLTENNTRKIMIQTYLPAIVHGDKRILMIDGEPIPYCLSRIPPKGETRANLASGGYGEVRALTKKDYQIAADIGPTLKEKGLFFVGLDVIGEHLTEINVTSPTCIREISRGCDMDIANMLITAIEARLKAPLS